MRSTQPRHPQTYDPHLRHLIRITRAVHLGASLGIPSSTLRGWLSTEYPGGQSRCARSGYRRASSGSGQAPRTQSETCGRHSLARRIVESVWSAAGPTAITGRQTQSDFIAGDRTDPECSLLTRCAQDLATVTGSLSPMATERARVWTRRSIELSTIDAEPTDVGGTAYRSDDGGVRRVQARPTSRLGVLAQRRGTVFAAPANLVSTAGGVHERVYIHRNRRRDFALRNPTRSGT